MREVLTSPLPIGGVLDLGFSLYKKTLKVTFPIALVMGLVGAGGQGFLMHLARSGQMSLVGLGAVIAEAVVLTLGFGVMATYIDRQARGEAISVSAALGVGGSRVIAVLLAWLLVGLIIGVGFILVVIPGIYFSVVLAFAGLVAVVEFKGPVKSIGRSYELVRGNWWRVAAVMAVVFAILLVGYIVFGVLVGLAAALGVVTGANPGTAANTDVVTYLDLVVGPLLSGLVVPFTYAMLVAVYHDLRVRNEGGDIAERIAAAEG